MNKTKIDVDELEKYLTQKGITFRVVGKELITKCIFSDCDANSRDGEAHLYFNIETGQYQCKKCDAKGNIVTLKKHFNDFNPSVGSAEEKPKRNVRTLTSTLVERVHGSLTAEIIEYLHSRGISDEVIKSHKIGYMNQYGRSWIAIPIKDIDSNYSFFKLRQDPKYGKKKITWPSGAEAQIYDWESLLMAEDKVLIAEGEMDALLMKSKGVQCITGTHGAGTTKDMWMEHFKPELEYFICYDNDNAGKMGSLKMAQKLYKNGCKNIKIIELPPEVGDGGDLGDYVVRLGLPIDNLFTKYAKPYPEKIDVSKFKEMDMEEVCKILDATIKKDDENKIVTFVAMLGTYTEDAQMNLFFNAPSSTGKSHIPLSVVELFPKEDVITLAYCSPTAFFHEQGAYNKEKNEIIVDLARKILIFTDMPDQSLLSRLRPILSHDQKESKLKITDKAQKGGNKTKNITLIGFPSVYFCSAGLKTDEQESTRFLMLSPSIEHEKIYKGIQQAILKAADSDKFNQTINSDPARNLLKKRILAIKQENILDVKIEDIEYIEKLYLKDEESVRPRQQRDIKKVISIIKGYAMLNLWFRKREGDYIWATKKDIDDAFDLWNKISYGQDYGLAPYLFEIYTKIIMALWEEPGELFSEFSTTADSKKFITRKEILKKHFQVYRRSLSMANLRQQILPQLEQVGLILQEKGGGDGREMVVIPLETEIEPTEINSVEGGGVKIETTDTDIVEVAKTKPISPQELPF
ncbi:MAG: toprim domain-containing protein [Candidatus Paceibacterota bacterium]|jgi:hypothetical protein